ncbi:6493_t:CDS:2, partial [Acaulospora colombiana]
MSQNHEPYTVFRRYTGEDDYEQVIREIVEPIDRLFPENVIDFLDNFFSEPEYTQQQWNDRVESLLEPEEDLLRNLKRLLSEL